MNTLCIQIFFSRNRADLSVKMYISSTHIIRRVSRVLWHQIDLSNCIRTLQMRKMKCVLMVIVVVVLLKFRERNEKKRKRFFNIM